MATTNRDPRSSSPPLIDDATLDQLMVQIDAEGLELLGPDGVLSELTSRIMNRAMQTELTDHMGYEPGDPSGWGSGNNRNGSSAKTVLTDAGSIPVIVPRDRNGTFEPKLIPKYERRLNGFGVLRRFRTVDPL
jgi:transposase-like protein